MRWMFFFCLGISLWADLTLEEKVGQLLMAHFRGETANEEAKELIQEAKVGGVIYYRWANGLTSPAQVASLSEALQGLAQVPLLIAVDQEGGRVTRLQEGFTKFPSNAVIGKTKNRAQAKAAAFATGLELLSVGVNMNLAPVVDVNSNPKNPVIGDRSFGDDPLLVWNYGCRALEGYKKAGVIATLKHFPGHGDVEVDSHADLPVVRKSMEELERTELLPFARLAEKADAIMTAHILVPALDEENCATLSEKTLRYLREKLGFQGVIVSDSLVMGGVLKKCHTVDEAAIQALNAGCDLLILGGKLLVGGQIGLELSVADVRRIHASIVQAVQSGRIAEEKINASVGRILALKKRYLPTKPPAAIDVEKHRALAEEIAAAAQGPP